LSWICLQVQASHLQACHIITKFASHTQAPVRFSLLAIKDPKPMPASIMVNNWQATIKELLSAAIVHKTVKSSYVENIIKLLEEKIKAVLAANKCNPIFHKFNPSPTNAIKFSGNIHCEAALASLIAPLVLQLYDCNDTSPFTPVLSHFHS
jgi:hypothetical protein